MDSTLTIKSIKLPIDDIKLLKELTKKFGWAIMPSKKKNGLEEGLEDIRMGRLHEYKDVDDLFEKLSK